MIASGIALFPPNTMAKPGAKQPAGAIALEHHTLDDENAELNMVSTLAGRDDEFAGTRITGTAS